MRCLGVAHFGYNFRFWGIILYYFRLTSHLHCLLLWQAPLFSANHLSNGKRQGLSLLQSSTDYLLWLSPEFGRGLLSRYLLIIAVAHFALAHIIVPRLHTICSSRCQSGSYPTGVLYYCEVLWKTMSLRVFYGV
jgi:hypothetical protein